MSTVRLNKKTIDAFQTDAGSAVIWDTEVAGFGLRSRETGRKYFVLKYRSGNRQRWCSIGRYGSPWTVETARKEARRLLGIVAVGIDPALDRKIKKEAPTISQLCDRFIEEYAQEHKKPRSVATDKSNIRNHIKPLLGHLMVKDITRNDIERFKQNVRHGKTPFKKKKHKNTTPSYPVITGGTTMANRCLALLSKMFNLAEVWGLRSDMSNPVTHIEKYKENKCERFLSADELERLGKALNKAETKSLTSLSAITAIRLLIYTGCRLSEILTLEWEHVDFEKNLLNLPDSKTGSKLVPLSPQAKKMLKDLPQQENNPYVIVGHRSGCHLVNLSKPWYRIRAIAKLEDVRLHDLRHTFASIGACSGLSLPIIGQLLGHSQAATTARYAHLSNAPLQKATELIGEQIAASLGR